MRIRSTIVFLLFIALQSSAASTTSGFAVAARWNGLYDFMWLGFGKIMKYTIQNGVTTNTEVLYNGNGRYAQINPDGQRVCFFTKEGTISTIPAAGGAATTVLTVSTVTASHAFMDWPKGDDIYYGVVSDNADKCPDQLWKVNVNTKAATHISNFTLGSGGQARIWQFSISDDNRISVGGPDCHRMWLTNNIVLTDNIHVEGKVRQTKDMASDNASTMYGVGCGHAVSSDGLYLCHFRSTCHCGVTIQNWDKSQVGIYSYQEMGSWGTIMWDPQATTFGQGPGGNQTRFSSNDSRWLVFNSGLDERGCSWGSNQELINWKDHEQIHTSNAVTSAAIKAGDRSLSEQNETGDFWVGNPPPHQEQVALPVATPSGGTFSDSISFTLSCATSGAQIYYTLDGSTPDNTKILYTAGASIKLKTTTTVKVIGIKSGILSSVIMTTLFSKSLSSLIAHSHMTATATSFQAGNEAAKAIDGDANSFWHTQWGPTQDILPQSITLALDKSYLVSGFEYVPRPTSSGSSNGIVTSYSIQVSVGTGAFAVVASGTWADDFTTKTVTFTPVMASNVRLVVNQGHGGFGSSAEINIAGTIPGTGALSDFTEKSQGLSLISAEAGVVRINANGYCRLEIAGLDGRVVSAFSGEAAGTMSIRLPRMKPGLYIARLHTSDHVVAQRMIITRR
jgi:hypothetical protein